MVDTIHKNCEDSCDGNTSYFYPTGADTQKIDQFIMFFKKKFPHLGVISGYDCRVDVSNGGQLIRDAFASRLNAFLQDDDGIYIAPCYKSEGGVSRVKISLLSHSKENPSLDDFCWLRQNAVKVVAGLNEIEIS